MGAKKSKLNKDVLDELCSKTKFRNYFRDNTVQFCSLNLPPVPRRENDRPLKRIFRLLWNCPGRQKSTVRSLVGPGARTVRVAVFSRKPKSPDMLFKCFKTDDEAMTSSLECIFSWTDIVRWITRIRIWPVIIAVTWEVEFWFWIRMFIIIQTTKFCFRIQYWNVEFFHRSSFEFSYRSRRKCIFHFLKY